MDGPLQITNISFLGSRPPPIPRPTPLPPSLPAHPAGGAIRVIGMDGPLQLTNVSFLGNRASSGGALMLNGATSAMVENVNGGEGRGGGGRGAVLSCSTGQRQ